MDNHILKDYYQNEFNWGAACNACAIKKESVIAQYGAQYPAIKALGISQQVSVERPIQPLLWIAVVLIIVGLASALVYYLVRLRTIFQEMKKAVTDEINSQVKEKVMPAIDLAIKDFTFEAYPDFTKDAVMIKVRRDESISKPVQFPINTEVKDGNERQ